MSDSKCFEWYLIIKHYVQNSVPVWCWSGLHNHWGWMTEGLLHYRLAIFFLGLENCSHFQQQFHIIKQRVKVKQRKVHFFFYSQLQMYVPLELCTKVFLETIWQENGKQNTCCNDKCHCKYMQQDASQWHVLSMEKCSIIKSTAYISPRSGLQMKITTSARKKTE